jgi:tRNA1(Val) A37 N6-methylase TrmN6
MRPACARSWWTPQPLELSSAPSYIVVLADGDAPREPDLPLTATMSPSFPDATQLADDVLTDDALTDRVRVLQRRRGHRYSVDDVVTAWVAIRARPAARSCLDLGCGLGSVLLMLVDRMPELHAVGIEAQAVSYALAQRNIERNGLHRRAEVHFADLRDAALIDRLTRDRSAGFELVTGTPPYKPLGSSTVSPDAQRAHARVELRGGIEAYLEAAARALRPDGSFVICAESALAPRVLVGALAARLRVVQRLDVVPMLNRKARLFSVYTLMRDGAPAVAAGPASVEQLVLRDASGARTEPARALRRFFGLDSNPDELASPPGLGPLRRDHAAHHAITERSGCA